MRIGLTRWHIGRSISWADFRDFIQWLPPTGESALHRARKPKSWWVTPDLQIASGVLFAAEVANYQRVEGNGKRPEPLTFPEDEQPSKPDEPTTPDELEARKARVRR